VTGGSSTAGGVLAGARGRGGVGLIAGGGGGGGGSCGRTSLQACTGEGGGCGGGAQSIKRLCSSTHDGGGGGGGATETASWWLAAEFVSPILFSQSSADGHVQPQRFLAAG